VEGDDPRDEVTSATTAVADRADRVEFDVPDSVVREAPVLPTIVPAESEPTPSDEDVTETMAGALPSAAVLAELSDDDPSAPVQMEAPLFRRERPFRRGPRPRVRRVTRIVRHVDTWSVFKVALVFNIFLYATLLTSGVLLWQVAESTGTLENIEKFFESFGWETFTFNGDEIFRNAWVGGLFLVVAFTGLAVLSATLFNLITDLVGGVRFSVLEEEVLSREDRGTASRGIARPPLPPDLDG
jgi:Transmembrane domain of unknown function (DUF3566)